MPEYESQWDDWELIRDQYQLLGETIDPVVGLIRTAVERWLILENEARVARENGRRVPIAKLAEINVWRYRAMRMLGSRMGRAETLDRVADQEGWW